MCVILSEFVSVFESECFLPRPVPLPALSPYPCPPTPLSLSRPLSPSFSPSHTIIFFLSCCLAFLSCPLSFSNFFPFYPVSLSLSLSLSLGPSSDLPCLSLSLSRASFSSLILPLFSLAPTHSLTHSLTESALLASASSRPWTHSARPSPASSTSAPNSRRCVHVCVCCLCRCLYLCVCLGAIESAVGSALSSVFTGSCTDGHGVSVCTCSRPTIRVMFSS